MNTYYYNKYKDVIDDTIEDISNYIRNDNLIVPFTDLEYDFQVNLIVNIIKSSKLTIKQLCANGDDVQLPYIGTVRIKEGTKIFNKIKEEIAIKNGYKSYDDIPNKIKFDLKNDISDRMKVEMMNIKLNKKNFRCNKVITNINIFERTKNKLNKT